LVNGCVGIWNLGGWGVGGGTNLALVIETLDMMIRSLGGWSGWSFCGSTFSFDLGFGMTN